MKLFYITNELLRLTWPVAKRVYFEHKGKLLAVFVLTIILGSLPTLKSFIEGALFSEVTSFSRDVSGEKDSTLTGLMSMPVSGLGFVKEDDNWMVKAMNGVLDGLNMYQGIAM